MNLIIAALTVLLCLLFGCMVDISHELEEPDEKVVLELGKGQIAPAQTDYVSPPNWDDLADTAHTAFQRALQIHQLD